jgi:hypothetical protein
MLLDDINKELDKHRVDEWHSTIPLSDEGWVLVEDLIAGTLDVLIEAEHQGWSPEDKVFTHVLKDNDYIYNIFGVGDSHGVIAQITRHDRKEMGVLSTV